MRSILALMGADLDAPDHTTRSRRSQQLAVMLRRIPATDPIHLIVDSTGLSIVGQGAWAAAKHAGHGERGWKKLHLGVGCDRGAGPHRCACRRRHDCDRSDPGVVARIITGPHEANRQDSHLPMQYDTGRPNSVSPTTAPRACGRGPGAAVAGHRPAVRRGSRPGPQVRAGQRSWHTRRRGEPTRPTTGTRRARPSLQARRPGGSVALLGDTQADLLGGGSPSQPQ